MLNKIEASPDLPVFFSLPFRMLPSTLHSRFLIILLNRLLGEQIAEGELDFLDNRCLCIRVKDAGVSYSLSLSHGRFVAVKSSHNDLMIQANVYDLLMLAARQEDPDTLVFQRRLVMEGDTELGLELKNFLDGLDIEASDSFAIIESLLQKSLPVYLRMFSNQIPRPSK
jgi:O2-independent ubiquinone biosynthesis accessory factor UbiT